MENKQPHTVMITRRIQVRLHHDAEADPDKVRYKEHWDKWRTINDNLYLAANRISSHLFFNDELEHRLRIQHPRYREIAKVLRSSAERRKRTAEEINALRTERNAIVRDLREQAKAFLHGGSSQNTTYRLVSDEFLALIPAEILTCLNQKIHSAYGEYKKEVARGGRALSNYKKGLPVPFSLHKGVRQRADGSYYVIFPGCLEWDLDFGRDRSNNREVVDRAVAGRYGVHGSTLQEKNGKIFLLLVVSIPVSQQPLNPERVVGIDLGLNVPIYAALNDDDRCGYAIGSRDKFMKERERLSAWYRELQRTLGGSTQGGRGRKHKLQALERFREKEHNWVRTQNHIFSREVIEFAKSRQAGVVQMEHLAGFGHHRDGEVKDRAKYILRYWSYFELQQLIREKARREGIVVRVVNPRNTSRTCSFCGHCAAEQRVSQSVFICSNCDRGKGELLPDGSYRGINADWNAARNIAMSRDVIKDEA